MIRRTSKIFPFKDDFFEGSWYGNTTLPCMVADLNKIIFYADKSGNMKNKKQRKMVVIVDAIISGEGDGPLNPKSKNTGLLIGGYDPFFIDDFCARIIGLDADKLNILKQVKEIKYYPIINHKNIEYTFDGKFYNLEELVKKTNFNFVLPSGWEKTSKKID